MGSDDTTRGRADRAALDAAMDRYADGEAVAFSEIYDHLAPRLLSFFERRLGDPVQAEDLVQQTLLHMHRARASFVRGSEVTPWAFAIARRLLIDSHRRRRVRIGSAADCDSEVLDTRPSHEPAPDELAVAKQMAAQALDHLDRLPEPQRMALQLVRDDGLSVREAAAVLGTSVAAVKQRVHRAYTSLRASLCMDDAPDREEDGPT